ncbi:hypothetical protein A2V54_02965 [candidate division WWE3 bacterium RBG_19FT_COMBO_53_11]|uniref:Uncharacterized protein n=1 Tax=candidate division WWE3 bacterium RBG_19FT_COMBO_53_11 TaxID=1802613 RepID=A0A1F4UHC7_UNCKA|nr:MAG: hypothetical protein A2V54_02965 [candidate division WWE3 bacterium RBG_19FT_COMBO_53_11]
MLDRLRTIVHLSKAKMLGLFLLKPSIFPEPRLGGRPLLRNSRTSVRFKAKPFLRLGSFPRTEASPPWQSPDQRELAPFKCRPNPVANLLTLSASTGRVASFT